MGGIHRLPFTGMENSQCRFCFAALVSGTFTCFRTFYADRRTSAILTMFQIPNAASDPLTRTAALLSLICALWSLSFGCIYIVRFGTMRTMYRASRWAEVRFPSGHFLGA